ncbi:MAG: glycosyltransferase family 4 protein, partial [Candidatus Obscuribacterales bacterium]|nr:glycosyltransferase family 4 protein [Candidatus Obscuribacterales bacterium]
KNTEFNEITLADSARRSHGGFWASRSTEVEDALKKLKPDLLYLNGYSNAIQIQSWLFAVKNKIPFMIRCDGDNIGKKKPWKSFLRRQFVKPITQSASRVTFQGRTNRDFWIANGAREEQLVWVPCVSDSEVFRKNSSIDQLAIDECRRSQGASPDDTVFVVSGKLESRKRPADAIKALSECKNSKIKLWFLGSGVLEAELQHLKETLGLSSQVTFLGFRNQSEMPSILKSADVLLHPSEFDPWPYAILDGAICGLALLLSSKTGSTADWIFEPACGMSFECGNIEQLKDCMLRLSRDKEELSIFKNRALERSKEYTEERFAEIFEELVFDSLKV